MLLILRHALRSLLALVVLSPACFSPGGQPRPEDPFGTVWQAWAEILRAYPESSSLNRDSLVGSAIAGLPGMKESAPYPFLTQVGRQRGQPTVGVPPELADLWRAITLHQKSWPAYSAAELSQAAVAGMVQGLGDPQASYVTAEQLPQARQRVELDHAGVYQGIGAEVRSEAGTLRLFPTAGGPAQRAGLRPGDVLLAVDGQAVAGLAPSQIIAQVRGAAGTEVRLTVGRSGQQGVLEYRVTRAELPVDTVSYQVTPGGIGYLAIEHLLDTTGRHTAQALAELARQPLDGLILDLRAMSGGTTEAALEVAGQFLAPGSLMMYQVDLAGQRQDWTVPGEQAQQETPPVIPDPSPAPGQTLAALPDPRHLPLAVVADENTLGPAEVLAAALQDGGRASVIGMATPGRAGSYDFTVLRDGSALYLPTARWYTPSGRRLSGVGVQPDEEVAWHVQNNWFGESQLNAAYQNLDSRRPVAR